MPSGIWPSDHQQRMSAFGRGAGPEQDLKTEAVDPEPFGRRQVVTGARDAQVACRQRFHGSIIADVAPRGGGKPGAAGFGLVPGGLAVH